MLYVEALINCEDCQNHLAHCRENTSSKINRAVTCHVCTDLDAPIFYYFVVSLVVP